MAAGNGNASLPAARRFADVIATDYVPELLLATRLRAEGVSVRTQVADADAQALPFGDGEFDVVVSTIGAMFAPDQEAVASELARVCRSGGRIGMANWTRTAWWAICSVPVATGHRRPGSGPLLTGARPSG